jgi:hypothetical protein
MANKIKVKRSYTAGAVPTTGDLDTHEICINWADNKLFTKNAAGSIVAVSLGGGSSSSDARWNLFLPPAPTSVVALAGNAQATLTWTAPTVLSQTPVTDYTVQVSTNAGSSWTTVSRAASSATSATVTGLTNGTSCVFRVSATNDVGTGSYSSASTSVTIGGDSYSSYVTLLAHMDGSGSSFVDSSGTPKTITAYGTATQSSSIYKFGTASGYFNGSAHAIVATSSAFNVAGKAFAIEFWLYPLSLSGVLRSILHLHTGGPQGIHISYNNRTLLVDNGTAAGLSVSSAITQDTWQHVAIVRSGGAGTTVTAYVNGTSVGSYTSQDFGTTTTPLIGWYYDQSSTSRMNAYIDDLRITINSARGYSGSTITVPTEAFPNP